MTEMEWIAALLCPRSVSPHPNFGSRDLVTPAGLLGLLIQGRGYDLEDFAEIVKGREKKRAHRFLQAAADSFDHELRNAAVADLVSISEAPRADLAMRTAAALLAAVTMAELDRHDEAVQFLRRLLERRFYSSSSSDVMFLSGLLTQQLAMRSIEAGAPDRRSREDAKLRLSGAKPSELSRYPVSLGSRWGAAGTNREMLKAAVAANERLFETDVFFPDAKLLRRWLRRPTPAITAGVLLSEAGAGTAYIQEQYKNFTLSQERTLRSSDIVDAPHWRSHLFFELIGHLQEARDARRDLAQLRLMRQPNNPEFGTQESLSLLRLSGDAKSLKLALDHIRSHGPLAALKAETERVVERRLAPRLLRNVEIATLEAGAQTLGAPIADSAFEAVLAALEVGPNTATIQRELPVIRTEQLFQAAAALAPVAGRLNDLASYLLDSILSFGATDDQLLARAHARGIGPIDWENLDPDLAVRWRAWATNSALSRGWEPVSAVVSPLLRSSDRAAVSHEPDDVTLQVLVGELNAIIGGAPAPQWLVDRGAVLLAEMLEGARREAARGVYSMYGFNPADIAVGLIQFAGAKQLWPAVSGYLTDPRVLRDGKTAALNRLAAAPEIVPEPVRGQFSTYARDLLELTDVALPFAGDEVTPYPAAVRALAALNILDNHDLLLSVLKLASGDRRARLEAARTLTAIVRTSRSVEQWIVATTLQLSNDQHPNVQAEIGRALALIISRADFAREPATRRLLELLGADGILVPLLVLRGMTEEASIPSQAVRARVEQLALEHLALGVRVQAGILLGTVPTPEAPV